MANRYGEAALLAVRMETFGKALTPAERWMEAVRKVYPTTTAGQKKNAPRAAFVGLCDAGLVKGVGAAGSGPGSGAGLGAGLGKTSAGNRNRDYAVEAVRLLKAGEHKTVSQLWTAVTDGDDVEHASQMDVVLALWKNGLIL